MAASTTSNPVASCLQEELGAMMSESMDAVLRRERTAFDEMAAPCERRLVLFGAGQFGRRTLRGLRRVGIEPLAFADNNPALFGKEVDGLPVLSPTFAADRYGRNSAFLITVWNGHLKDRTRDRIRQLTDLGCGRVISAGFLFWKYPDVFLPFYPLDLPHKVLARADDIMKAFPLWDDDVSRREYVAQVPSEHYFHADLFRLTSHEVLVDCSAFEGDTIRSFVARQGDEFARIVAYEPDDSNSNKLLRLSRRFQNPSGGRLPASNRPSEPRTER